MWKGCPNGHFRKGIFCERGADVSQKDARFRVVRVDLEAVVEETYNEAMRLYEYYERMNEEIAKQEQQEAAEAAEAEGVPLVIDAEMAEGEEVRSVPLFFALRVRKKSCARRCSAVRSNFSCGATSQFEAPLPSLLGLTRDLPSTKFYHRLSTFFFCCCDVHR